MAITFKKVGTKLVPLKKVAAPVKGYKETVSKLSKFASGGGGKKK